MADSPFDVLTIGNANVDVNAPIDPDFLKREGMDEGIMHLVDAERSAYLYERMPEAKRQISGGSAANTAAGVASLGGKASFIGKVAADPLGQVFADDLHNIGVHYGVSRLHDGPATARSIQPRARASPSSPSMPTAGSWLRSPPFWTSPAWTPRSEP